MGTPKNRTAAFATPLVLVWGLVSGCAGHGDTEPAHTASVRASATPDGTARALARIEHRYHARLGVFMVDTGRPATDMRRFVLGDALPASQRQLLTNWIVGNTTGGPYIRAGVPFGWKVGDKTGNGGYGTRNDIAVAWPTSGAPIVIAILSDRGSKDASSDDALIADATKTGLAALR
jgi:hypothetical protein